MTPGRIAENADVFSFEQMSSMDGLDTGNRIGAGACYGDVLRRWGAIH